MIDQITVTKLDAARRQLAVAIEMIFSDDDIVAAHTLVGAASNIISDLVAELTPDRSWDKRAQIDNKLSAKDYFTIMRRAQNFFKHAKDDPDVVLNFEPSDTDSIAFWAVMNIGELGHDLSMRESVFQLWYLACYSPVLDDGSDAARAALEVFGDLRQDFRKVRLSVGAQVLAQHLKGGDNIVTKEERGVHMPYLSIRLGEPALNFRVSHTTEEWGLFFRGNLLADDDEQSFTVKSGEKEFDALGANVRVYVHKRPPISEQPRISADKPWDSTAKHRDRILVSCPESSDERLSFEISVSLPPDAYQRVIDTDWKRHVLTLTVDLSVSSHAEKPVLRYCNNYDVSEVEWLADNREYLFLDGVTVYFSSVANADDAPDINESADAEKILTPLEQILASSERTTNSIRDLRGTVITAAWILAVVLIVAAFIR